MKHFKLNVLCYLIFLPIILLPERIIGQSKTVTKSSSLALNTTFFINQSAPTIGQSFIANQTGLLTSIVVKLGKHSVLDKDETIKFWIGTNPEEGIILEGEQNQLINLPTRQKEGTPLLINLETPFPVEKGKTYRMQLGVSSNHATGSYFFEGSSKNSYPHGALHFHDGTTRKNRDLNFSITITKPFISVK